MLVVDKKYWKEVRCTRCRALLGLEYIYNGRLMIKCYKCNEVNEITYKTSRASMKELQERPNPDAELLIKRRKEVTT